MQRSVLWNWRSNLSSGKTKITANVWTFTSRGLVHDKQVRVFNHRWWKQYKDTKRPVSLVKKDLIWKKLLDATSSSLRYCIKLLKMQLSNNFWGREREIENIGRVKTIKQTVDPRLTWPWRTTFIKCINVRWDLSSCLPAASKIVLE